ncbi:MAG TPA: HAMP domain-containing sensor histidine kinase [Myxococcota bacterium]|nr:HAMP domain-containing sensor histidine kinase [Myxococcota bacterium]
MPRRSIRLPLALGIALACLTAALAVGWQVLLVGDWRPVAQGLTTLHWVLIVLGSLFFVMVLGGLVWLCAWLVREMRLNQRQQAFLDAVTHEMKTPLASLSLYLETLSRHDPAPERRRVFLERMQEDVRRLENTVGQVLAATRAEVRRRAPAEPLDLGALLHSCVEEVRGRHGLSDEAVRFLPGPAALAFGNRAELQVVFRNLLENAVKYSDGPVDVRASVQRLGNGRVRAEIADRGIGLERRELRRIFQRFYQASRDVQRQAQGLGLGLFVVRQLVRRQGGSVQARSDGPGRGSRFTVTLRTPPQAPQASSAQAELASPPAEPRWR